MEPDSSSPDILNENKEFRFAKLCAANASHQRHDTSAFACDPHGVFFIE